MRFIVAMIIVGLSSVDASLQGNNPATGVPAKCLASCEADLTGDGLADLALLLATGRGQEAVVLVATNSGGYNTFVLSRGREPAVLRCAYASEVRETRAGGAVGRIIRTPGRVCFTGVA